MESRVQPTVEVNAVVFPPCAECGTAYKPSKPVEDYGTVFFQSADMVANLLFRLEVYIRNLRRKRMRSL